MCDCEEGKKGCEMLIIFPFDSVIVHITHSLKVKKKGRLGNIITYSAS